MNVRIRRTAFADLAIWMLGLGIAIGSSFPFVVIVLGVPARFTLRPSFFSACLAAGIALAAANHLLARRVVGARLEQLSQRMRYVAGVIADATYTGDWSRCSPSHCNLPVESEDQFGAAASSFNQLISSLAASREVQQATTAMGRTLSGHLELNEFAPATLHALLHHVGADAGGLCVVRDGELAVAATHRIEGPPLAQLPSVLEALSADETLIIDLPDEIVVTAALLSFRPACIALQPLRFRAVPIGIVVLAFDARPAPEALRLLTSYSDPMAVALNNVLAHERFQRLAALDPLTGAYNRRFGLQRLNEEWSRSTRADSPLGVLALDLDHFKTVNDTHGHLTGDRVLREAASAVRNALREGDVLVRMGGEEFLVVLPGAGGGDIRTIGERIRRAVAGIAVPSRAGSARVTVSLGGACAPEAAYATAHDLVAAADDALYASKRSGRDRLTIAPAGAGVPATTSTDVA